ncbi:hypothetical protein GUITHDRAFT_155834 [Guillardia theta CCMP2712]|uniref:Uncharacterized protein n=1 Tax=Guillardia theta (strain CCMP2712) TaxID=905079 RepID=L1IE85_GUITC|nr:hypothetical protein GUITHDRAFT_155834 [Guillardia theta CCMP2712]EKX34140.1 hypothetical protein GUITHDRAFT_155834 [Guillardia theta CCMP2712]|eukprot:XP_005821120.1 hypothetical protein GUITHDRAFT_155834 [Guillardia theta CCMP2712]
MHMLKNYGVTLSIEAAVKTLSSDFRGLKRTLNLSQSCNQDAKVTTGNVPLSYDLYSVFAKKENMFGPGPFLILAWNLMSRSRNVCTLLYNHMEFVGDALRFYVIYAKNDQAGEKPRDPKYVYSNVCSPEVCPLLALGRAGEGEGCRDVLV